MADKILHHNPRNPLREIQVTITREEFHAVLDWLFDSESRIAHDALENMMNAFKTLKFAEGGE
jgi:hypothetical protein